MTPAPHTPPREFDAVLWSRLETMQIDAPEASLTFTRRLARDNGWSLAHARAVVSEYRRFLYLAARAGHPVTPSDAVDQAWHLHLVYTRHYWGVLCREILGFELHHGPTLGGESEQAKFGNWYERTLDSYRAAFGEPPVQIWPGVADRFEGAERMQRIDRGAWWLIPKPSLRGRGMPPRPAPIRLGLLSLILGAGGLLAVGPAATWDAGVRTADSTGAAAIVIAAVLVLLLLLFRRSAGSQEREKQDDRKKEDDATGRGGCGGGCGGNGGSGCGGSGCGG
jgi:hypothetical protein